MPQSVASERGGQGPQPTGRADSKLKLILSKNSNSGYAGVCKNENRWRAKGTDSTGKRIFLGAYGTKEEAAGAYAAHRARTVAEIRPNATITEKSVYKGPSNVEHAVNDDGTVNPVCVPIVEEGIVTCDDVLRQCITIDPSTVRNVQRILVIGDFKKAFQDADGDLEKLQKARQQQRSKQHLPYADASVKVMIIAINTIIKEFQKDIINDGERQKWIRFGQEYNRRAMDLTLEKQLNEVIMDFDDFLQMMKEAYGVTSKEYMIAVFYSPLMPQTFRDDLQLEVLIKSENAEMDPGKNYIVIENDADQDKGVKVTIHLNVYKTLRAYGAASFQLPSKLVELVTNYVDAHKIVHGEYLFGPYKLADFIANMTAPDPRHKLLGSVRINTLRQMRISKICAGKVMSPNDWGQLAFESKHGVEMTPTYIRKILKWDTDTQKWVDVPRGEPNPEVQNADDGEVSQVEEAHGRIDVDGEPGE